MSLNWLKENIGKARAGLSAEVSKFSNRTFLEAVVNGCVLVASADGSIDSFEKRKMMGFLERSEELKHFEARQVIEVFKKAAEDIEFYMDIGRAGALRTVGKVKSNVEQSRLLVRVVCAIAGADGTFDDDEKTAVRSICQELGLPASDFDL